MLKQGKKEISVNIKNLVRCISEAGYNPYEQLIAYLTSGDSKYITRKGNARKMVKRMDRVILVETMLELTLAMGTGDNTSIQKVINILKQVYIALSEAGYDPIKQIAGYMITGNIIYITSNKNAREYIGMVDIDLVFRVLILMTIRHNNTQ